MDNHTVWSVKHVAQQGSRHGRSHLGMLGTLVN